MFKLTTVNGSEFFEEISKAKLNYSYLPELTKKLDSYEGDFTEHIILGIVLWKTNRYPKVSNEALHSINELRSNFDQVKAETLLGRLLESPGFDLPMASTVLRFACPERFQIIDQRVYRLITLGEDKLRIPTMINDKIVLYFKYLNRLRNICETLGIPFSEADRILYQLDKEKIKSMPIH